jgi:hypothetical protein
MKPNEDPAARDSNTYRAAPVRSILLIGVDPALIDAGIMAQLNVSGMGVSRAVIDAELAGLGFTVQRCVLDLGATAESVLEKALSTGAFDCVMIGAGLRLIPEHTLLFERVINVVHRLAPVALLSFNSYPGDTVDAARRSLATMAA